ncbi:MAG: carboxypeptidase-like regulatory domain-containing protein [Planctomycetaceae bacterium]
MINRSPHCASRLDRFVPGAVLAATPTILLLGGLFSLSGCGAENELGRLPVSGTVLLDGEPLDSGTISFDPIDQATGTSGGATVTAGQFEIATERGLPPGIYRVRISAPTGGVAASDAEPPPPGEPTETAKERIPASWNTESQEQVEVKEGEENIFTFPIVSLG